ncbi:MAG: hypothetical protein ACREQ5_03610 [Candidatus Dormibacteria bacterium]
MTNDGMKAAYREFLRLAAKKRVGSLGAFGVFEPFAASTGTLTRLTSVTGTVTNAGMGTIDSSTKLALGIGATFTPARSGNVLIVGGINTGAQASQNEVTVETICTLYRGTGASGPAKNSDITMGTGAVQIDGNRIVGMTLAAAANGWFFYGDARWSANVAGLPLSAAWVDFGVAGANAATDAWQGAQYDVAVLEYQ